MFQGRLKGGTMQPGKTPLSRGVAEGQHHHAQIVSEIRQRLGQRRYELWCEGKTEFRLNEHHLIVAVGSPFLQTWLSRQFRGEMLTAVQSVLGTAATVEFQVDGTLAQKIVAGVATTGAALDPLGTALTGTSSAASAPVSVTIDAPVPARQETQGRHTAARGVRRLAELQNFQASPATEWALAAAHEVARRPGEAYSLLYIHGPVGCGKTHLLEGIRREFQRCNPGLTALLLTAEGFANSFTNALRDKTLPSFRQQFRTTDALLMDDLDFFEGKRVFQEEFLHTIADLTDHGRQVVLTGDRHPRLMTRLPEELISRVQSGLVCRLEAPDEETRRKIVRARAARMEAEFTDEALDYVAQRFRNNVRELEGALTCLQTAFQMTRRKVTLASARQLLSELERDCLRVVRLDDIERAVCDLFGVKSKDLKSDCRARTVSQPRMLAMYLARKHTQAAYTEIGKHFGGRNHSTVMSAERKVEQWLRDNEPVKLSSQVWSVADLLTALEQRLLAS